MGLSLHVKAGAVAEQPAADDASRAVHSLGPGQGCMWCQSQHSLLVAHLCASAAVPLQGEVAPETGSGQAPLGSRPQQTQDTDAAVVPSISCQKTALQHLLQEHPKDEGSAAAAAAAAAHAAAGVGQVPHRGHLQAPNVSSQPEQSAEADSPGSAQPALKRQRTQHC